MTTSASILAHDNRVKCAKLVRNRAKVSVFSGKESVSVLNGKGEKVIRFDCCHSTTAVIVSALIVIRFLLSMVLC